MVQKQGIIVAIDGPDGIGKTTQIHLLEAYLKDRGLNVYTTRASGGTPIGEALRLVSLSDTPRSTEVDVYISLAMHTALGQDLQQRKADGQVILVDRSPLAIVAYNTFGGQLAKPQDGFAACEKMLRLWRADTLIVLEAPQDVLNSRLQQRTDKAIDYFEKQGTAFHERVSEGYRAATSFAQQLTDLGTSVTVLDGAGSVEQVQKSLQTALNDKLSAL